MDTRTSLHARRDEILAIAANHGARNVRVFGSVARGEARPDSDIDILVDMEPGRSLFDLGGLLVDLQRLLEVDVDVVTEKGLRPRDSRRGAAGGGATVRSDRERLLDIVEAIEKIEQRVSRDLDEFAEDEMQQVWVIHHLQIIGEAASRLSEELRSRHPEVPWDKMIGMRHVLVHGYFQIDLDVVWAVIEKDLSPLSESLQTILASES